MSNLTALIACIGRIATAAAQEVLGRPPDVVAKEDTVEGLVLELRSYGAATS